MDFKVIQYWEDFKTNFWFIPMLILFVAIVLAILLIYLDYWVDFPNLQYLEIFSGGGAEGARSILSTVASSMMTVAGVVFSITLVALTLASSQFGPRLLRNYMKNRLNQVVLGTYVATFIYCLIILGSVSTTKEDAFIPQFSVLTAILAAVGNIFLLIVFIHQISTSIQAEYVIAEVSKELDENIRNFFPEKRASYQKERSEFIEEGMQGLNKFPKEETLKMWKSGYLQALNEEKLLSIAVEYDLLLEYEYRPGGFAIEGINLVKIHYKSDFQEVIFDKVKSCFVFGKQRSHTNDPEYVIHQLVEIAARALSPGINDPYTAISCSDKLGAAIGYLMSREFPSRYHFDENGELRLMSNPIVFEGVVAAAFNQIRQYGRGTASVLIHLLDIFLSLSELVEDKEQIDVIRKHADIIMEAGTESLIESNDIADLKERYEKIKTILQAKGKAEISAIDLD